MANSAYALPEVKAPASLPKNEMLLIASGDLRQSANQVCWAAWAEVEKAFAAKAAMIAELGIVVHPCRN